MKSLLLIFLLIGCAGIQSPSISYEQQDIPYPTLESFPHCRSYGCKKVDMVSLHPNEQRSIRLLFQDNQSSRQERHNIKNAIAKFEKIIGTRTGTSADVGGTYVQLGHMQQDCIDESTNTTTYLILLDKMELLRFHDVNALTSRPPILSGRFGPHRTAVIVEKETNIKYAVDSWFHDNGIEPEIIELSTWRWGWHPES